MTSPEQSKTVPATMIEKEYDNLIEPKYSELDMIAMEEAFIDILKVSKKETEYRFNVAIFFSGLAASCLCGILGGVNVGVSTSAAVAVFILYLTLYNTAKLFVKKENKNNEV